MTDWRSSLRCDPIPWLLENACPAVRFRVLTELLDLGPDDYPPSLKLQRNQRKDGSWGGRIHASDPRKFESCVENVLLALFERGWSREVKSVRTVAKTLRSFLTQKRDLNFFEFGKAVKADDRREQYYRWFLRIVALGLLVRAGYLDERNRLGVLELLDLTSGFVDSPASRGPTEEIGASHPLIRFEAFNRGYPFLPDVHLARVFAFSPWLLGGEMAKMRLKKVFDYVMSAQYQALAPDLGLVRTAKGSFVKGFGIRLQPVEWYQKHGHLDELLGHLELLARLGLVNRYPVLMSTMDWLQSQQTKEGRWNMPTKLWSDGTQYASVLRLEKDWRSPARKEVDMTFRVLLIFKYQWERQMAMLDRREDGYPI